MKTKDFKDLRNKEVGVLRKLVSDKKHEISVKSAGIYAGKEKNLKLSANLRREVAKILTVIREKEIVEKLGVNEQKRKENA